MQQQKIYVGNKIFVMSNCWGQIITTHIQFEI